MQKYSNLFLTLFNASKWLVDFFNLLDPFPPSLISGIIFLHNFMILFPTEKGCEYWFQNTVQNNIYKLCPLGVCSQILQSWETNTSCWGSGWVSHFLFYQATLFISTYLFWRIKQNILLFFFLHSFDSSLPSHLFIGNTRRVNNTGLYYKGSC